GAVNVGLLHTALDGREGHAPYAPCTLSALVGCGYDYFALGHVHRQEIVSETPWVVYPGNLQGRHARETGPKGAMLVGFDGARVTSVAPRALDVVRWAKVSVEVPSAATLDDVGEAVRRALNHECRSAGERLVAARVEIVGPSSAHAALRAEPQRVTETVRAAALDVDGGSVWVERAVVSTHPLHSGSFEREDEKGPLADLGREIARLKADPAELAAFLAELPGLGELWRKARPLAGAAEASTRAPAALLEDAHELLLGRLAELAEP
ncbi:MAG TPA: DNA repair exonuclease, partial [Polyangiaceae bacterium]|nr:DNA repair exonuclease [Polyangiaceae bacterium]